MTLGMRHERDRPSNTGNIEMMAPHMERGKRIGVVRRDDIFEAPETGASIFR